jgi:hypothetical protein
MLADTDRERPMFSGCRQHGAANSYLIRWLASRVFVAVTAIMLAAGSAASQDTPARGKLDDPKLDDPPPLEDLLKSPPSSKPKGTSDEELSEFHRTLRCEPGRLSCNDPIAFGAQALYARIRDCWHPPLGARMTTAIFFGQTAAPPSDPAVATLAFTLNTDGMLGSHPHLSAPAALGGAVNDLVRAVEHCQPYNVLPQGRYPEWKDVRLRIRIELNPRQRDERPGHSDRSKAAPSDAFHG